MIDRTGVRISSCRKYSCHNEQLYGILQEHISPRTISTVVGVKVVRVCAVRTVVIMSGLVEKKGKIFFELVAYLGIAKMVWTFVQF